MARRMAIGIRELSRRQVMAAAAWTALNGVLTALFILLLVDEAAAHGGF